jgi:hypothetical protein
VGLHLGHIAPDQHLSSCRQLLLRKARPAAVNPTPRSHVQPATPREDPRPECYSRGPANTAATAAPIPPVAAPTTGEEVSNWFHSFQ